MKKCPTCAKEFEDSMRFCQVDGTPLVDEAPAFDPYATIVAPAMPVPPIEPPPATEAPEPVVSTGPDSSIHATVGSIPISEPDEVLDLPSSDPLKTMYVSEAEMKDVLSPEPTGDLMEIPPIEEKPSEPEMPSFLAPEPTPAAAPPPSPFSAPAEPEPVASEQPAPFSFDAPEPTAPAYTEQPAYEPEPVFTPEPAAPAFDPPPAQSYSDEAATMIQPQFNSPFEQASSQPPVEWAPPPAPEASWQNQEIGSNTPFSPPPAGTEGQNKTLAIVSLVLGILGVTICCGGLIPSIAAIITGFMARGKANSDPAQYGGGSLAMWGIITGIAGLVLGIIVIILQVAFGLLGAVGR